MLELCLMLSPGLPVLLGSLVWLLNHWRKLAQTGLMLPDGSPTVDEFVTRPMLDLTQTCVLLCRRIYDRVEDLPSHLEVDGWTIDDVFANADLSAVCAIVYRDDGPCPSAIVVWRGTKLSNRKQVRANRRAVLVRPGWIDRECPPGRVHSGLRQQWSSVGGLVLLRIAHHLKAGRKVYVTGHSQGGGLAALTVAWMRRQATLSRMSRRKKYLPAGLITFGAMRTGDDVFADYVRCALRYRPTDGYFGEQRYRNNNDIVPLVPPKSFGYSHSGEELYIWPCGVITRQPHWVLRLVQRVKPWTAGIIGDGVADHAIAEYSRLIHDVRIPAE